MAAARRVASPRRLPTCAAPMAHRPGSFETARSHGSGCSSRSSRPLLPTLLVQGESVMASQGVPNVDCEQHHASLVVTDVQAAVDFYTSRLGFTLSFTSGEPTTMAGVNLGQVQIFLERGTPCPQGCAVYFVVGDADELHAFHRARQVEIVVEPEDRLYDLRDYTVRDLHGY